MRDQADVSARRQRTRTQLLTAIRENVGVTRAGLGGLTGLSRSAIAAGVQDLLAEGLITEDGQAGESADGRGRPAALLSPAMPSGAVIGVDFGHAHVGVAVADTAGRILGERQQSADVDRDADMALETAVGLARQLLDATGMSSQQVREIAAGVPGPLDPHTSVVRSSAILSGWVGRNPADELAARVGHRVHVRNAADMGALGELRFGAARGLRDFLYVKVSDGIGAGLVLGGQLYRGTTGVTGEIGHIRLADAGDWCRCGNQGCLETVASTTELRRRLSRTRLAAASGNSDLPLSELSGDPAAARIITETGRTLGRVLAELCNCLNPAAIILGGELGAAGHPFVSGVRESIDRYALPDTAEAVHIHAAELGTRSELMGAIALAIQATVS
jgi:predicted NBD/HSP70 family sugar kinase